MYIFAYVLPLTILSYSPLWWEHHLRQWDHFLSWIPRGVPQLGWLLLADHSGSRLWYQTELHLASGSRATWLHHCMVWNDISISPLLGLLGTVSSFLNMLLKIDVQICLQVWPVLLSYLQLNVTPLCSQFQLFSFTYRTHLFALMKLLSLDFCDIKLFHELECDHILLFLWIPFSALADQIFDYIYIFYSHMLSNLVHYPIIFSVIQAIMFHNVYPVVCMLVLNYS